MKRQRRYGVTAGLVMAVCVAGMPVYAKETGTIKGQSETVYREKDEESGAAANIIAGGLFSVLETETDGKGALWYLVETDMGIRGYIRAEKAVIGEDTEGTGDDQQNRNSDTVVEKQVRTTETVNMRSDISTEAEIVGQIPQGTLLDSKGIKENEIGEIWYEVSYEGIDGYIRESTVEETAGDGGENMSQEGEETSWGEQDEGIGQVGEGAGLEMPYEDNGEGAEEEEQEEGEAESANAVSLQAENIGAVNGDGEIYEEEKEIGETDTTDGAGENADDTGAENVYDSEETKWEPAESAGGLGVDWVLAASCTGGLFCIGMLCFLAVRIFGPYRKK